jgi:hypothetical protein
VNTFARQRKRLTWTLAIVFAVLALAGGILVNHAFGQLRYEAYFTQRQLAEDFASRVSQQVSQWMSVEDGRPPTDYEFLIVSGEAYVQRSPLSTLTPDSPVPGLLGYFQVDAQGRFSTPLLPVSMDDDQNVGLTETEIAERASAAETMRQILAQDSVASAPAPAEARADRLARSEAAAPAARNRQIFDELQKGAPSRQTKTKSELGAVAEYELQAFADEAAVEEDALNEAAAPTANVGERKQSVRKVRHTRSGAKSEAAFELSSDQRIVVFESTINTFNWSWRYDGCCCICSGNCRRCF